MRKCPNCGGVAVTGGACECQLQPGRPDRPLPWARFPWGRCRARQLVGRARRAAVAVRRFVTNADLDDALRGVGRVRWRIDDRPAVGSAAVSIAAAFDVPDHLLGVWRAPSGQLWRPWPTMQDLLDAAMGGN